jgi:leader peptidase (prepilin peptidase) / N-methyltransferase
MIGIFVFTGAVVGLMIGSFSNVVVYRTPRHLSVVRPGSFCPTCGREIEPRDNVPVFAWLWLRGKCRHCAAPISARYPIVEAGTAVVFVALAATVRPLWGVPGWWILTMSIAWVAVIELDGELAPAGVPLTGTALGMAGAVAGAFAAGHTGPLTDCVIGLGAATALAAVLVAASRSSARFKANLSNGAVWTLPAFGACVGWLGTTPALVGAALSAIFLVASSRSRSARFAALPIATCLAAGLIGAVVTAALSA